MGRRFNVSSAYYYVADCGCFHLCDVSNQEYYSDMQYLSALRGCISKRNQVKDTHPQAIGFHALCCDAAYSETLSPVQ